MDSGCTLLGADRRIARSGEHRPVDCPAALRHLGSPGAAAGLDGRQLERRRRPVPLPGHRPRRHEQTFTPTRWRPPARRSSLPPDLQADALIWVQDAEHSQLCCAGTGAHWAARRALLTGGAIPLRRGAQRRPDRPLPAVRAARHRAPATRWACWRLPPRSRRRTWACACGPRCRVVNPVNSGRVNIRLPLAPAGSTMALRHAYRWAALGDGVCPNGTNGVLLDEQHSDAALQMTVESDPPGATASGVAGGLFWVGNPGPALGTFDRGVAVRLPASGAPARCRTARRSPTRSVTGTRAATPWKAPGWTCRPSGHCGWSASRLDLGDIPPGGEGTVTFPGTVDRSRSQAGLAAVLARLHAATNGPDEPLEWLVAAHRVDRGAPEEVGLHQPGSAGRDQQRAGWAATRTTSPACARSRSRSPRPPARPPR